MSSVTAGTERAPGPTPWQRAVVVGARTETASARTLRLRLQAPSPRLAGQHYVVRLTAPDGYTASRSYSVGNDPDEADIALTVERLADGEVSPFLHDEVVEGDEVEVRGPLGGHFTWTGDSPALLVGGGSGVVPLMSMLRLARRQQRADLVRLCVSARTAADLYHLDELVGPEVTVLLTREAAPSGRPAGRVGPGDLPPPWTEPPPAAYVCGSAAFCDAVTDLLLRAGYPAAAIRVERFGATG